MLCYTSAAVLKFTNYAQEQELCSVHYTNHIQLHDYTILKKTAILEYINE